MLPYILMNIRDILMIFGIYHQKSENQDDFGLKFEKLRSIVRKKEDPSKKESSKGFQKTQFELCTFKSNRF